jgi:hypothetical protein
MPRDAQPKHAGRITLTGGTVFFMWLAEQVTLRGIGASDVIYGQPRRRQDRLYRAGQSLGNGYIYSLATVLGRADEAIE